MWRVSFVCMVCLVIGASCLGASVRLILWGVGIVRAFEHERRTPLATVEFDCSQAGFVEVPVRVNYPAGHGFKVLVEGPTVDTVGPGESQPWLKGLTGTGQITHSPWGASDPQPMLEWLSFASGSDSRGIVRLPGSPPGNYRLRLAISEGAAGLVDQRHRLVVYNDVCGCETMAAFFGWAIAGGVGLVGVTVITLGVVRRHPRGAQSRVRVPSGSTKGGMP